MGVDLAVPPELAQQPPTVLAQARAMTVASADDFTAAGTFLKHIKTATKTVTEFFAPLKRSADDAKKSLLDAERKLVGPLAEAEALVKKNMLTYDARVKQEAEAERRRLQAEADERARRDKAALEKVAAQVKKPETKERYLEQAAAVIAPVVHVEAPAPKVAGISTRSTWKAEIVDRALLIAFAIDNRRTDLLLVNEKVIEAYGKAMREEAALPGVRFYEERSIAAGAR